MRKWRVIFHLSIILSPSLSDSYLIHKILNRSLYCSLKLIRSIESHNCREQRIIIPISEDRKPSECSSEFPFRPFVGLKYEEELFHNIRNSINCRQNEERFLWRFLILFRSFSQWKSLRDCASPTLYIFLPEYQFQPNDYGDYLDSY